MCFQPLKILNSAYLFIQSETFSLKLIHILNSLQFTESSSSVYKREYTSKNELKEILSFLHSEGISLHTYPASISRQNTPVFYKDQTLYTIYNHTFHEGILHIITSGDLESHLQPIVHLQSSELYGFESLLRDMSGQYSPYQLFDTAQKTNLHSFLDKRAREVAIKSRGSLVPKGIKSFINFLPSTIYSPEHCLEHTFKLVEKHKVSPDDLVFEVVESEKIEDIDHLLNIFQVYRKNGMKVALDDVGSGFATLETLKLLQPDYAKIDRAYISYCDQSKEKENFLKEIVAIGNEYGISILAEGIERKEELEFSRDLGIQYGQGYYIEKPSLSPLLLKQINMKLQVTS
ncbi:EAL domain-containing protein [Bacillus lacus]|uniref:EAL domain-containing protein n=2 Tax=Metabacillus lacus TaxID=1983721 RepID=A0A7X2J014_9BACI|nr:EAL domain-containing protein [Metabacillus lacus]